MPTSRRRRRTQPLRLVAGFASGPRSLVIRRGRSTLRVIAREPVVQNDLFPTADGIDVAEVAMGPGSERVH